ncbi:NAD-dependent malic enzyme [invertebrate metagenome]|uniref:NAD-dependent malic enzyme n=1 Tax=invertebrate metagenome TaxID=1711999 RepID=A0A2H9T961_9ZZZZ
MDLNLLQHHVFAMGDGMSDNYLNVYTSLTGRLLLENPVLNKGTAFSPEERTELELYGLLPPRVETLEEQCHRTYETLQQKPTPILKHLYLRALQDTNETLFYSLVKAHLEEILPIIYTPVVGQACQRYSDLYRRPRGLYVSWPERDKMDTILANFKRNIEVIVVTDGERILGLGDQGIGGMSISIGKLSLYTAVGGIAPNKTLPIVLDCGTNNQELLHDDHYLGWRHERLQDEDYYNFVDQFIQAVQRRWPNVLFQFEDFAINHATPLLEKYRDQLCTFNDDIQGTAAVTAASLVAACKVAGKKLEDLRIAFLGAGSAGCGIADQLVRLLMGRGLSEEEAKGRIYMVDRYGLLHDKMEGLRDFQQKLTQPYDKVKGWSDDDAIMLEDVVDNIHPDAIVGVCGQPGKFSRSMIQKMAEYHDRPIIMPLSNPVSRVEAFPEEIIKWTEGRALIATGSPFLPVEYNQRTFNIAQCNNIYIFPGLGLGVLASGAQRVSDAMLDVAVEALASAAPALEDDQGALLPELKNIEAVTNQIALAVAMKSQEEGLAPAREEAEMAHRIAHKRWKTIYPELHMTYC